MYYYTTIRNSVTQNSTNLDAAMAIQNCTCLGNLNLEDDFLKNNKQKKQQQKLFQMSINFFQITIPVTPHRQLYGSDDFEWV